MSKDIDVWAVLKIIGEIALAAGSFILSAEKLLRKDGGSGSGSNR